MKRFLLTLFSTLFLALGCATAYAWNAAGHRLAAAIAWRELTPATREAVAALLARHPDYPHWIARAGADPAYIAFLEASTWPDDIRRDPRFHDPEDDAPTPRQPGFPDMERHKDWHYVDRRPDGSRREGDLDRQLDRLAKILADPRAAGGDQAYALPWLIHLVADGHQPLHVGVHDDEGGNRVDLADPFNPRLPVTNLHTWWDDLPGPPWLRGERLERAVAALLASHPVPRQSDVEGWLRESRQLAQATVYPPAGDGHLPTVSAEFRAASRAIANRRLVDAGYRLGRLLESCLGDVSRGTEGPPPAHPNALEFRHARPASPR